jgi:hypothetical protein
VDEIAGLRARREFAALAPAYFAYAGQHICDGLLLAMMVNSGAGARLDLEHAAPHRRFDAELRRNCSLAFRAGRLQRAPVEFTGVNDTNCRRIAHRYTRGYRSISSRSNRGFANEFSRVERDSLSYVGRRGSCVGCAYPNVGMRQTPQLVEGADLGQATAPQGADGLVPTCCGRATQKLARIMHGRLANVA